MLENDIISDELFEKFARVIYDIAGIYLKNSKKILLANRLRKRLHALNISDYETYFSWLALHKEEVEFFINVVSTNETYFFRSESQLDALAATVLPAVVNRKGHARIWSAGCSTGEEPYSIAIVANELGMLNKVEILATDINSEVLQKANEGIYGTRKMKYVNPHLMEKYFLRVDDENCQLTPILRKQVKFDNFNLMNPTYPKDWDIIFCRNVMIYFTREVQTAIVDKFHDAMNPGGFFFIGHAETLYVISDKFKYLKIQNGSVYLKE